MTDRAEVNGWVRELRDLADRVERAEHGEEVVEVADEAVEVAAQMRAAFPDVTRRGDAPASQR